MLTIINVIISLFAVLSSLLTTLIHNNNCRYLYRPQKENQAYFKHVNHLRFVSL